MSNPFPWGYPLAPDDAMNYDDILMGHSMQQSASPPSYYNQFAPPGLHNFLKDGQRTAIFNADVPSNPALKYEYHNRPSVGINPVHRPPQARYGSPISTSEPSSASGSAHSPPADTEDPSSPPEEVLFSPFTRQVPYNGQWSTPEHSLQFGNMGPVACVNPIEVNSQQPDFCDSENENIVFDFGRTHSWDSYSASQCDAEPASYAQTAAVVDIPSKRMSSPEDIQSPIKEEIEAAYPESLLGGESDDEQPMPPPPPKRRADNDEEWKPSPSKKGKTNSGRPTTRPRSRSTKSTPESPPQAKKRNSKPAPEPSQLQKPHPQAVTARRLPPQANPVPKNPLYCREQGCPTPKHSYPDKASLDAHTKKKHTRPYICVFHFAGCESTFASKNEWKRHVNSQHILLNYWICQEDECSKTCNGPSPVPTNSTAARGMPKSSNIPKGVPRENIPNGSIFNRKDLYTQHMRRMHMPESLKGKIGPTGNGKKAGPITPANSSAAQEWEKKLRDFQEGALRERCRLPVAMTCPAHGCVTEFHGPDAWDQRMEHVARHLDGASQGREPNVEFGGDQDACLTKWAGQEEVAIIARAGGRWVLEKSSGAMGQGKGRVEKGAKSAVEVADEIVVGEEDDDCDLDAEGEPDI
ncbi:hypothetical protein B0T16DRAFT_391692 [Cercophora newfieldiana]|uniref:C2H2-type domain-containing protein n=1 Tax=Cercophora newfieldiana TaxID=92897 RepID=A0AA39XZF4_9PEZI|nr:hypothetical protein B0T16DRAFT_391692 [Cercophora newfieldiana]